MNRRPADLIIRDATGDDQATIGDLWRAFRDETPEPAWRAGDSEQHRRALAEAIDTDIVLIAELGSAIAGMAVAEVAAGGAGYLHILYVPPRFRRLGVAAVLVRHVSERLQGQGLQLLGLDVLASNTVARTVYRRWGFSELELTLAAPLELLLERL